MTARLTTDQFIQKANEKHNYKFTYDGVVYKNNSTKVSITCPIHGEFQQTPSDHLSGYGCPGCRNDARRYNKTTFVDKAISIHGPKYNYDKVEYINISTKVIITCYKHGDFAQTPNGHLNGQGCKKCNNTRGENQIYVWLTQHGFTDFIAEKTFDGCLSTKGKKLRYDFFIPSHNLLIEFDGAQHFDSVAFGRNMTTEQQTHNYNLTVLHDSIKNEYATQNGYQLLRIRYDDNVYDKLSEYFRSSLQSS